jgi:hypothetical protein
MALGFSTATRTTWLQTILDGIDAGPTAGLINIYAGVRPATGGAAGTLLAQLACSDPASVSNTGGILTLDTIASDTNADASGTATWFRVTDSTGAFVLDGSVGITGADLNLNTTAITAGDTVSITSFTLTAPNA